PRGSKSRRRRGMAGRGPSKWRSRRGERVEEPGAGTTAGRSDSVAIPALVAASGSGGAVNGTTVPKRGRALRAGGTGLRRMGTNTARRRERRHRPEESHLSLPRGGGLGCLVISPPRAGVVPI